MKIDREKVNNTIKSIQNFMNKYILIKAISILVIVLILEKVVMMITK